MVEVKRSSWRVAAPILLCVALLPISSTATEKTVPVYGRAASPAEVRASAAREAALTSNVTILARKYQVQAKTLMAIAHAVGIASPTLSPFAILQRVEEQTSDVVRLNTLVRDLRAQIGTLTDPALRDPGLDMLTRAQAAIDDGRLEDAERDLANLEYLRRSELEISQTAWASAVRARADIAQLAQNYDRATELLLAAHRQERERRQASERRSLDYLQGAAAAQHDKGERFGDRQALRRAIRIYREEVLPLAPRKTMPLEWGRNQHNLGNALQSLGEIETDSAALEEAVETYREALKERTLDRAPIAFAETQKSLGNTLKSLGDRETGTARLQQSLDAFEAALNVSRRHKDPYLWATATKNQADILVAVGRRESAPRRFEQAISMYQDSLQVLNRESYPLEWTTAQNGLGNALNGLGEATRDTERFQQAVRAYDEALLVATRERFPAARALVQSNRGHALSVLGNLKDSSADLDEALRAFDDALMIYTQPQTPWNWANTELNRGNVLAVIGRGERGTAKLEQAAQAYRLALTEFSAGASPFQWATATLNLAHVRATIAARRRDIAAFDGIRRDALSARAVALKGGHQTLVTWGDLVLQQVGELRREAAR